MLTTKYHYCRIMSGKHGVIMRKSIALAQNYLKDPGTVAAIVRASSIDSADTVYEIGPGNGIITRELAKIAGRVIAIEKDRNLALKLKAQFQRTPNVKLHASDFLDHRIEHSEYKLFSNIPFNITAAIIRKILYGENPVKEAYLIMQKEAAQKFAGHPDETQFSILAKPWFSFSIIREFERADFEPVPDVDVVLLHVQRRKNPLVLQENAMTYNDFIRKGFGAWKKHLKAAYKNVFTYVQWKTLSQNLHFPIKATPTQLTFEQWLGVFKFYLGNVHKEGGV